MMKKLIKQLLLAALTCAAGHSPAAEVYFDTVSTAKAARLQGGYFSAGGGIVENTGVEVGPRLKGFDFDNGRGWAAGLKFGYSWVTPLPIRPALELELGFLGSDMHADGGANGSFDTNLQSYSAMANFVLALDFEEYRDYGSLLGAIKPYVGAGAGIAYVRQDDTRFTRNTGRIIHTDVESEVAFAYQFFGGVEVELAPEFSLYSEYKFVNLPEIGGDVQEADFGVWSFGMKLQY